MAVTIREGFLQDIVEHPDDDTPRLIFADWLEEHGEADRAEFVRAQITLARLDPASDHHGLLAARTNDLLAEHALEWVGPLAAQVKEYTFRRGFIAEVSVTATQFFEFGTELVHTAPIESFRLEIPCERVEELARCPLLRRVRSLEVRGHSLRDAGVAVLMRSEHRGAFETLILHHCGLTAEAALLLVESSPHLLTGLNLGANDLGDDGAALLCACPQFTRLRYLGLGGNEIGPPTARALATSPSLRALEKLNLGANYLDDAAVAILAEADNLANLRELDLRYNEFGFDGARALAGSSTLGNLTRLDVTENALGPPAADLLRLRYGNHVVL